MTLYFGEVLAETEFDIDNKNWNDGRENVKNGEEIGCGVFVAELDDFDRC